MKMTLILLFLLFTRTLLAPESRTLPVSYASRITDPVLTAFMWVESSYRTDVVNKLGYSGILQIGPEMVAEANRLGGDFTFPASALDSVQSVRIWYIVQGHHNPSYNLKRCSQIWNPKASNRYLKKVEKALNKN